MGVCVGGGRGGRALSFFARARARAARSTKPFRVHVFLFVRAYCLRDIYEFLPFFFFFTFFFFFFPPALSLSLSLSFSLTQRG